MNKRYTELRSNPVASAIKFSNNWERLDGATNTQGENLILCKERLSSDNLTVQYAVILTPDNDSHKAGIHSLVIVFHSSVANYDSLEMFHKLRDELNAN